MLIVTAYFFLGYLWVSNHVLNDILHSVQMPDTMQVMEANCMSIQIQFNFRCCFCLSA